jgi:hypothetical protein
VARTSKADNVIALRRLREHITALSRQFNVDVHLDSSLPAYRSFAIPEDRIVLARPIRSQRAYAGCLHEIGHCVVSPPVRPRGAINVLHEEFAAWRWARAHALVWTPTMRRYERMALLSYVRRRLMSGDGKK